MQKMPARIECNTYHQCVLGTAATANLPYSNAKAKVIDPAAITSHLALTSSALASKGPLLLCNTALALNA
jgi:hypothetical protein